MMTSSNGNIFRVTGPLCGEFTGPGDFPTQRPVTRSFGVFFDLRLNRRLSKQPWGWWFETLSWSLWRHLNGDGISNHQRLVCLRNRLFRRRSKKTPKLRVTGLCERKPLFTCGFPSRRASNAENVSIWWRHHGVSASCVGSSGGGLRGVSLFTY